MTFLLYSGSYSTWYVKEYNNIDIYVVRTTTTGPNLSSCVPPL